MVFWHEGLIGADIKEKVIHSVDVTAANVHNSQIIIALLYGNEKEVWGVTALIRVRKT